VERYVLPKFKVAIEFTEKDNKPIRDYRPGEHVTGTVRANYFFGKPVDHADIAIKASSMDVIVFQAASVTGKTDSDGAYRFDLKLPSYFAGRPLSQGAARALIEATVKDSAAHAETRGEPITISESPLLITAVPEGGTLIPNIETKCSSSPPILTGAPRALRSEFTFPTVSPISAKSRRTNGSSQPIAPEWPYCASIQDQACSHCASKPMTTTATEPSAQFPSKPAQALTRFFSTPTGQSSRQAIVSSSSCFPRAGTARHM